MQAIQDAVTLTPGINQSRLIENVKTVCDGVGVNRIRTLAGWLVDAGKMAAAGGEGKPLCYYPN